jgi:DNA sulfur modification protein DndD
MTRLFGPIRFTSHGIGRRNFSAAKNNHKHRASGTRFPIVIDTPLARLDTDHRSNVLRYFAAQAGEQVIFLSQPDEVHGSYLKVVKDRVCKAYHIEFEELDNGVGKAHVRDGYFPSEEV